MKHTLHYFWIFFLLACSTTDKKDSSQNKTATVSVNSDSKSKWQTYVDTVNTGFILSFLYPSTSVAEHFENAECFGKPIKPTDEGPKNSMDCSIWMNDPRSGNGEPIDTLIQYEIQSLETEVDQIRDSLTMANTRVLRVKLMAKTGKTKILKQLVYFTKYDTFFEIINNRLSEQDFMVFANSLKIEK